MMDWFNKVEAVPPSWQELLSLLMSAPTNGWIFRGISDYESPPNSKLERVLMNTGTRQEDWKEIEKSDFDHYHLVEEWRDENSGLVPKDMLK